MALAAIHNGADAVYFGVPGFNARGRSADFDEATLKELIETCHLYGVKAHLAFNVVIFENELPALIPLIKKILALKPDSLIVQDLGLVQIIRAIAPTQVLHASTQMTVTNHEAISFLEDLELKRFVLGRENSLSEIELIAKNTDKELEVFVHGALCVSYSGQCFTSESIGGRSANRGQCAQSCRFSYELFVDGEKKELQAQKFLVSPQDLCGIEEIPQLMKMGVSSFKVEGRLKAPEYVATAARSYRQVIDQAANLKNSNAAFKSITQLEKDMAVSYSRGFCSGWLQGVNHQKLVDGTFSSHRGFYFAEIVGVLSSGILLKTHSEIELKNGDGLLWVYNKGAQILESGSHIYSVQKVSGGRLKVELAREVRISEELIGAKVYLNHDKELKHEVAKSFQDRNSLKRIPVQIKAQLQLGEPLRVTMSDGKYEVSAISQSLLSLARTAGLSDELLKEELGALSGSVFIASKISLARTSAEALFLSHKELKELRRQLQTELSILRSKERVVSKPSRDSEGIDSPQVEINSEYQLPAPQIFATKTNSAKQKPQLNIVLRQKSQVEALALAVASGELAPSQLGAVILDFEFGRDFETSLRQLKALGFRTGLATTRILKPGEYGHLKAIVRMKPDVILARSLGAIQYFTKVEPVSSLLFGDFSLNVTNHLTAKYLLKKGLHSVCASYDLNQRQVRDLLVHSEASKLEVTIHQYMPSFHMEHCVFAALLSEGSSWRDCGKPCEKHRVELKDQFGNRHFIKADQECRNTMYNATPQTALNFLNDWSELGLGSVRYEALFEEGQDLLQKIKIYISVLENTLAIPSALKGLQALESYGLDEGAVAREQEYQSRKKEH